LIAILDYGSGNLRSAERAFALTGQEVIVTSDRDLCLSADGLVVPGVGAFSACMEQLRSIAGEEIIAERLSMKRKIFGICVGMQIFFAGGTEKNGSLGLGIWPGEVSQISAPILPHIGWNTVSAPSESSLFKGVTDQSFYFVHSFAAKTYVPLALNTICEYGEPFLAAVESEYVVATQFHPEKSGDAGAQLIMNWVKTL
jgi:glutamine amidotransferase